MTITRNPLIPNPASKRRSGRRLAQPPHPPNRSQPLLYYNYKTIICRYRVTGYRPPSAPLNNTRLPLAGIPCLPSSTSAAWVRAYWIYNIILSVPGIRCARLVHTFQFYLYIRVHMIHRKDENWHTWSIVRPQRFSSQPKRLVNPAFALGSAWTCAMGTICRKPCRAAMWSSAYSKRLSF